jgi:hypothetical protein
MRQWVLITGFFIAACGSDGGPSEDASTEDGTSDVVDMVEEEATLPDYCESDEDCDDGDPCSGTETCDVDTNTCHWGTRLDDGTICGEPRLICVRGRCGESVCGDGYLDRGAGEFCEPSLDPTCLDGCTIMCLENADCNDDDFCNGTEHCDTTMNQCRGGVAVTNGTVCDTPPRQICLYAECVESVCGDGYIDVHGGEECECEECAGEVFQECTTDCGIDGMQACNWICRWTECTADPPPNDACADGVDATAGGTFVGTTCSATNDWGIVPSCVEDRAPDVFYGLSLGADATVEIHTCDSTGFDTVLALLSGACDGELTEVACSDDATGCGDGTQSSITESLTAGEYVIIVDGKELMADTYSEGSFTLTVSFP